MSKYVRLIAAAVVLVAFASLPAQAQSMKYRWGERWQDPEVNNALSARYDWLLQTHPGFRAYRMRKECGPIDFVPAMRADCFASFDQYEPVIAGY